MCEMHKGQISISTFDGASVGFLTRSCSYLGKVESVCRMGRKEETDKMLTSSISLSDIP